MGLKDNSKFRKFITKDNVFWFYPIIKRYFEAKISDYVFSKNISYHYSPHWDMDGVDLTLYGIELVTAHFDCGYELKIMVDLDKEPCIKECDMDEYKKEYYLHRGYSKTLHLELIKNCIADILDGIVQGCTPVEYTLTDIRFIEDGNRLVLDYSGYKYYLNNLGGVWCWID